MFLATTMLVRILALPPGTVMPPARGPSKPNNEASALAVYFSITVREGDT